MPLVSKRDIERAELNGISRSTLLNRVYSLGMEVEEAIAIPVMKNPPSLWRDYESVAVIGRTTFYSRVRKGWGPKEAAITPLQPRKGQKIFPEHIKTAKKHGISHATLKMRVNGYHWSLERATTEPIHENFRRDPDWNITQ
jgi:hypothetical protein